MSLYELLLFAHVLAAAAWFGAALLSLLLLELATRARETGWVVRFGEFDDHLAKLLFIPAALVVLASGVALVLDGHWTFREDGWATVGLVLFAVIFVLGVALIVPAGARLTALAREGAAEERIHAQLGRLRMLSWIDVALLAIVIFLMTTKPF
ncbi:MAG TPA: DUF2269 family protein [Gaiellaceae bacterium]|nr:DUF2269 family protein [Gaiellaceae bacterium]